MTVIDAAISRSRTVLSALLLILISGTYAYIDIPKESDPDINIPIIYVSISHEGISPEDAERLLIRPMEQELRTIEGMKEMRAVGYEGGANMILEFEAGFDSDQALTDVREQVDTAKPELPEETEEPSVEEVNFSLFPVIVVTLAGDIPERALLEVARDLREELEGITTVLKVEIAGDRDELVEVLIDPIRIESYGLSVVDTVDAVRASNLLVAAGQLDTGEGRFAIKVPGLFEKVQDITSMPVATSGDAVVVLGDIGDVRRNFKDPESFARVNGRPALALEVTKRTGENIIETIESVRQVVEREREFWPQALKDSIEISYLQDRSSDIRNMLSDLQNNVISAVLLVMVVIIAALGWRSAFLVGIAIPGSFLTAILVLYGFGVTVNIVVLFSLILAVGMLVDGAIVVTEYADRKMIEGEHRSRAYGMAARRMAWPIIASTATTLAAFLPLVFWPGVVGEFMKYLPMTLLITLTASLVMALIFVPTLGALFGRPGAMIKAETAKGLAAPSGEESLDISSIGGFTGGYVRVLNVALSHPIKILLIAVAMLVGIQVVYANFGKGVEFFPDVEPEIAQLQVRARGNLSVWEQRDLMQEVEARLLDLGELDSVYTRTGKAQKSDEAEDIIGIITLEFADWDRRRKAAAILDDIRERTKDLAGIHIDQREQEQGPPVGKAVQVQLAARSPDKLDDAVQHVLKGLDEIGGFINIEDERPLPGIDWVLDVDRSQAAKYGANIDLVGRAVQLITNGIKLGEYRPDNADEEIDIRARYPREYRTLDELGHLRVETEQGAVPIENFVKREPRPSVGTIKRADSRRVMNVKADVQEGLLVDEKVKALKSWLQENPLPDGIEAKFKGEDEEQQKAQAFLGKAFMVALFIMAIILVTQFNSFYSAFLILSAVIMSTVGVFIGLLVTAQPFGIVMGGIGVIALAGIVVNNNIVLIDTFDRLKHDTVDARDALIRTGAQRLRPVLLTTITTVLGLMPMVVGLNINFVSRDLSLGAPSTQWWQQLSTAIVFGLMFATVLTLVVTPSALMVRANLKAWWDKRRAGREQVTAAAE